MFGVGASLLWAVVSTTVLCAALLGHRSDILHVSSGGLTLGLDAQSLSQSIVGCLIAVIAVGYPLGEQRDMY